MGSCLNSMTSGAQLGDWNGWGLGPSGAFLTHLSGTWAGVTQRPASAGPDGPSLYLGPSVWLGLPYSMVTAE